MLPVQTSRRRSSDQLDVELEQQDIAILDDVLLAFDAVETLVACGRNGAACDKVAVGHGLRLDKAAIEIRMDHARGLRRGISLVNGPGANLLFTSGEVGLQPE